MALERIYMFGPDPSELDEPVIDFLEWLGLEPIDSALCVHGGFHEAGIAQHPQVLRHSRLRHPKLPLDLSDRSF